MINLVSVLAIIGAYLVGSVNFSILISRLISGKDIRESGSGNAGATNMLRTYGKKIGVLTLILDLLKGIVVVALCRLIGISEEWTYISGVSVALGHNYPVFFGFKGGKGVATSLGVAFVLDWRIGILIAVIGVGTIAVTRYVSLGSMLGGAVFIIAKLAVMLFNGEFNVIEAVCSIILGGLLIYRHRANIKRLVNGTENKLGAKKE